MPGSDGAGSAQRQCPAATICGSRKTSQAASAHPATSGTASHPARTRPATSNRPATSAGYAIIAQASGITMGTPTTFQPSVSA